jgi:hypothetical protein
MSTTSGMEYARYQGQQQGLAAGEAKGRAAAKGGGGGGMSPEQFTGIMNMLKAILMAVRQGPGPTGTEGC